METRAESPAQKAMGMSPLRGVESLTGAVYVYDGDGTMVKSIINGVSTYYAGRHYNITEDGEGTHIQKTYAFGSMTIAVRTDGILKWLLADHLGSTTITANEDGSLSSEIRYSAFGEVRYSSGTTPTDYQYTNQLNQPDIGLYYYVARFYDPVIAHFVQADAIVPGAGNPAAYDRYAYVFNNPIRFIDPFGRGPFCKKNLGPGTFSEEACGDDGLSYHGEATSGEITGQAKTAASAKKQSSGGNSTTSGSTSTANNTTFNQEFEVDPDIWFNLFQENSLFNIHFDKGLGFRVENQSNTTMIFSPNGVTIQTGLSGVYLTWDLFSAQKMMDVGFGASGNFENVVTSGEATVNFYDMTTKIKGQVQIFDDQNREGRYSYMNVDVDSYLTTVGVVVAAELVFKEVILAIAGGMLFVSQAAPVLQRAIQSQ